MDERRIIDRDQVLAGIRVLAHLIRADGVVSDEERRALTPSLEILGLDARQIEALVAEDLALAPALEAVTDAGVRRAVIRAAHAVAHADGLVPEEAAVIEAARSAWGPAIEDPPLEEDLRRLAREEQGLNADDPKEQKRALARLVQSWTLQVASLALSTEEEEARWRGRPTDIGELTRRFMRGEATAHEVSFKFKEDIGEA